MGCLGRKKNKSNISLFYIPSPPPPPPSLLPRSPQKQVTEIKKELDLLKIPHTSFFEKREFAEALARARVNPPSSSASSTTSRGDNVDPDEDPSQYRFVEVKRMPKEGGEGGGGAGGGPGAGAGGRAGGRPGPGPGRGGGGGGGDPFSDIFNARGGAGGAAAGARAGGASGPGGFADAFFKQAGGARGGGSPFGGGGGMPGMGGIDPSMLASIMSNPRAQAAFQRAQKNPKVMAALQDVMANPANIGKYANDKEVTSVLNELQSLFRK